jgi:replicative DNA helicase
MISGKALKNVRLEQTILASALYVDGVIQDMSKLKKEDFSDFFYRDLFTEIYTCCVRGYDPEPNLIIDRIVSKNDNYEAEAYNRYAELAMVSTSQNIEPHIKELKAITAARSLVDVSLSVISSAESIVDYRDWVMETEEKLRSFSSPLDREGKLNHISHYFDEARKRFEQTARGEHPSIKTGIEVIDNHTGGVLPGEYVVFGGRPGAGKTSLGLTVAKNVAKQGYKVGVFSIEVKGVDIVFKLCSMESSEGSEIPYSTFRGRTEVKDHHIRSFGDNLAKLNDMGIYINDSGKTTVEDIETELRRFIIRENLDMVIIDHIGIVKGGSRDNQKRNEKLQEFSIKFAELWKEFNVAGIVLIQLKRSDTNKIPTMDSLAECSQFEKDAHLIYMIHIPDLENVNEKLLVCAKGRDSGVGVFPVGFSTSTTEFTDSYKMNF